MEKTKLKLIKPIKPVVRHNIDIPERFRIDNKVKQDANLKKLTFKEKIKIIIQDLLQEFVLTISDNLFWIKWLFVGLLFVGVIVNWMFCMQEHVEEQLAKPIEKLYNMAIEFGFASYE